MSTWRCGWICPCDYFFLFFLAGPRETGRARMLSSLACVRSRDDDVHDESPTMHA